MSPYRDVPEPAETNQYIELPNRRPPRYGMHSFLSTALMIVTHGAVVYAIVAPFRVGAPWWSLGLGVLAWPLLPVLVSRRFVWNTQLIGTQELVVQGLFRDRKLRWSEVLGVESTTQPGLFGDVLSLTVNTRRGDFRLADFKALDPQRTLDWALDAAAEGRLVDIAERVAREGKPRRGWQGNWAGIAFSLFATALVGYFLLFRWPW
jgi:hypothetical protein